MTLLPALAVSLSLGSACAVAAPPAPSEAQRPASVVRSSTQTKPQPEAADARGTEKYPVSVKLQNSGKSDAELEEERLSRESEQRRGERTVEFAAWALGVSFLAALIAFAQVLLFARQLNIMRTSLRDTEVAALAAKQSAISAQDALEMNMRAEAPFLIPEILRGINFRAHGSVHQQLTYLFRNEGKTPAIITRFQDILRCRADDLPGDPTALYGDDWANRPEVHIPIGPSGATVDPRSQSIFKCGLFPGDHDLAREGGGRFLVVGRVKYSDTFGRQFEQRFCLFLTRFVALPAGNQGEEGIEFLRAGGSTWNYIQPIA